MDGNFSTITLFVATFIPSSVISTVLAVCGLLFSLFGRCPSSSKAELGKWNMD
jgi:hypothetical protein